MKLIIVESPGKIKTIQSILGKDYVIKASIGHCFQIVPENSAIDIENNYEPTYRAIPKKKQVISDLKKLSAEADEIFICSDDDREGAFIGHSIARFILPKKCNVKRAKFHEITKTAILSALKNPTNMEDDMNLVHSQKARSVLDFK